MLRNIKLLRVQMPILKSLLPPLRSPQPDVSSDQEVHRELETVLASEFFRGTKRCQCFLRFVVETVLSGDGDRLKERTLGIEIFGRSPSYDTGEDAIVRVKANEVRRRMAQYNATANPGRPVKIELLPGSYVPQFRRFTPEVAKTPVSPPPNYIGWAAAFSIAFLVLVGAGYAMMHFSDPVRKFWEPVLTAQIPPIICLGDPDIFLPDYSGEPSPPQINVEQDKSSPAVFPANPAQDTRKPAIMRVSDSVVGIGDSNAGFLIGRTLQSLGRPSRARLGDQVSFSDLKGSPVVLIGAFSNRWTMFMTSNLRFSFMQRNGKRIVIDRDHPSRFWGIPSLQSTGKATEDYAIVTRVHNSSSGQGLICVAGISNYGSQAAGEFVTDEKSLQHLIRLAPKNWENMNMQVVLKTTVVNDTPGPAEIAAVNFW
jgi:hypothetical protein